MLFSLLLQQEAKKESKKDAEETGDEEDVQVWQDDSPKDKKKKKAKVLYCFFFPSLPHFRKQQVPSLITPKAVFEYFLNELKAVKVSISLPFCGLRISC